MRTILSLDAGTTSVRAALYDHQGVRVAMASQPLASHHPLPGWVEQDPEEIWLNQLLAARQAIEKGGSDASEIAAIGITNQRETTIVWEKSTGRPIAPAIVWQCRRTADACRTLAQSPSGKLITERTGLVVDAYSSASKVRWILDSVAGAQERAVNGELLFGNVDTWLIWRLTDGRLHVTDVTNASRTMLMSLDSGQWDPDLLSIFGVPAAMLPKIVPSSALLGETSAEHLGAAIPIAGIAGDQQSALFGQACFRAGLAKNTYGTGCFALLHTGDHRPTSGHKLLATAAATLAGPPQYALEGSVFVAGAAIQWLRDGLRILSSAQESEDIALSVEDSGGVYLVPAFVGLGAPHWDSDARGTFTGLSLGTNRAHLVRAALESIAYQTRELIDAMQADSGKKLVELRVDGGAASNDFLLQFQADLLGIPVVRPTDAETTALGAAYLAGLATGYWSGLDELESFWKRDRTFTPNITESRRDALYQGWRRAIRQTRTI